ncbi:MAG TPA: hypothetical protein EYN05_09170 [Nitrospinaceae bacterium]|nr:hypothetical protein [Nitrospinaceae bacterium]
MIRFAILTGYLVSVTVLFACGGAEEGRGPVIQPKKEATWVRTEKVQTTTEEIFSNAEKKLAEIPINTSLVAKITSEKPGLIVTTDVVSCLDRLESLDLRRTLVQKFGGMWGAFERNVGSKPYSFYGMQLDSNVNKMVFSLRYLCQTSEGVPLNNVAIEFKKLMQDHGREEAVKILLSRGEHPEDIEVFLNYEEFARKIRERKIDFKVINPRLDQAELLIDLYEELSNKSIDEQSTDTFLSNSVTLLKVMNEFLQTDQMMVMALNEDGLVPYHHIDQDM